MEPVVRAWDLRLRRAYQRLANNAASSLAFRRVDSVGTLKLCCFAAQ